MKKVIIGLLITLLLLGCTGAPKEQVNDYSVEDLQDIQIEGILPLNQTTDGITNFEIDSNLLGEWEAEQNASLINLIFNENGKVMMTSDGVGGEYDYSATDGIVEIVLPDEKVTIEYSIDVNGLIFDGTEFTKVE